MTGKVDPVNEVRSLNLGDAREVRIGKNLSQKEEEQFKHFLKNQLEVFEWEEGSTARIDESIIRHELQVKKGVKPVKQKKRSFESERNQVIFDEV
ncbi:UNVERIFIED_CONTAM: hypothetical protein Slati_2124400 [Sesamum latifolium]|uniref:Uncharacterized protein n=1 Tax=Sesamum latifolium TaxID=2727402 RepID=A0AAW2WU01_9LAMI